MVQRKCHPIHKSVTLSIDENKRVYLLQYIH